MVCEYQAYGCVDVVMPMRQLCKRYWEVLLRILQNYHLSSTSSGVIPKSDRFARNGFV